MHSSLLYIWANFAHFSADVLYTCVCAPASLIGTCTLVVASKYNSFEISTYVGGILCLCTWCVQVIVHRSLHVVNKRVMILERQSDPLLVYVRPSVSPSLPPPPLSILFAWLSIFLSWKYSVIVLFWIRIAALYSQVMLCIAGHCVCCCMWATVFEPSIIILAAPCSCQWR